jgi:type IV pilus assembly protein PilB
MADRRKLGQILIDAGAITSGQLKAALEDQQRYGGRLGTILLERRIIDEKTFFRALSSQLNIPAVDFTKSTIPEAIIKLVPKELTEKYLLFPVATRRTMSGNVIVLAMADPTNVEAQDEIRFRTGFRVEPCLALESTIRQVIREYWYEQDGKGAYRYQPDIELGPGKSEEESAEIIRDSSQYGIASSQTMTERDMEIQPEGIVQPDTPQLTRELKALLRLLAKKGIISQKEYLDEFNES